MYDERPEQGQYMAPAQVACYECDSTIDGGMCYDPTCVMKQSKMCGLNATNGAACAVSEIISF